MLNATQLTALANRMSAFAVLAESIPGVMFDKVAFDVPVINNQREDLISVTVDGDEVSLNFTDYVHTIYQATPQKVAEAIQKHIANALPSWIPDVIRDLAEHRVTEVADISEDDLPKFFQAWSDAYGEDKPDCFLKKNKEGKVRGFIKTRLTPAQIAAKNNEDGDADAFKNAMPLFGAAMPA